MTALVNYDYSDDEESSLDLSDRECQGSKAVQADNIITKPSSSDFFFDDLNPIETEISSGSMFEDIPKPIKTNDIAVVEDELEKVVTETKAYERDVIAIPRSNKRKIQIIAHRFESEDSDSEDEIKQNRSTKNCSLLKLLPPPINKIRHDESNILQATQVHTTNSCHSDVAESACTGDIFSNKGFLTNARMDDTRSSNNMFPEPVTEEEDDGTDLNSDFFSLSKKDDITPVLPSFSFDNLTSNSAKIKMHESKASDTRKTVSSESSDPATAPLSNTCTDIELPVLPDELKKICGKGQTISFTDVRADEIIGNNKEMLLKNITDDSYTSYARSRVGMPNTLSKRKHQMTYLAYLAKEQEQDLKNMWAQNRMNKRESRMKYGF